MVHIVIGMGRKKFVLPFVCRIVPSQIDSRFATGNSLKRAKELQQVLFLRRRQFGPEDQIEKFDRIIQRQEASVVSP